MRKDEIDDKGFEFAYTVSSWIDVPEIGTRIDKSIDWIGLGNTVTADNQWEYMEALCNEAQSNARQFSPFEQIAAELNSLEKPYDVWEVFESGIQDGITKRIREARKAFSE